MDNCFCVLFSTILGFILYVEMCNSASQSPQEHIVSYVFKEFPYKDTPKNELTYREFETACEQSNSCNQLMSLARTRCIRECISPSCYKELYQVDPLEEGEIDVRLNSFKGCFIQRTGRTRN